MNCLRSNRRYVLILPLVAALALSRSLEAQHAGHGRTDAAAFLLSQASGTSASPAASSMSMFMTMHGDWHLMLHGVAFLNFIEQSGRRGGESKAFSTNWIMGSASRPMGNGAIMLRSMLSLEPATISDRKYPLLFQTGETAFGKQSIDGRHPHDSFMELAAEYARPIGPNRFVHLYVAPVGDPALGPVAFPHRASESELPQAVIGHHYQDSTHISGGVITGGVTLGVWESKQARGPAPSSGAKATKRRTTTPSTPG